MITIPARGERVYLAIPGGRPDGECWTARDQVVTGTKFMLRAGVRKCTVASNEAEDGPINRVLT